MSENQEDIQTISDEDFAVFTTALFGPYKGPYWNPE
jgi:hypothetical protein